MSGQFRENQRRAAMEQMCHTIAEILDQAIQGAAERANDDRWGFCLMLFEFGEGGNMSWISNAERPSMIEAVEELLEKVRSEDAGQFDAN